MSASASGPVAVTPASAGAIQGGIAAFLRRHALGIGVALLLTAFLAGPRWWLLSSSPSDGARVQVAPWAASDMGYDLALFAPAIRDAYDGSATLWSRYDPSNEDTPTPPGTPWLYVIGLLGRATGDPFSALAIVTALMALSALLLLYALALELTDVRWISAAVLPIAVMAIGVVVQAHGVLPLRHWDVFRAVVTVDAGREFHAWYRFVPPSLPLPVFLAAVIALPRAVDEGRQRWMVAAALSLALLIYTYLFYWSAMAVALGAWCAWLAYQRDYRSLRRLIAVGVIAVVVASPELGARLYDAVAMPADPQSRFGKESLGIDPGQFVSIAQRFLIGVPFLYALLRGPRRDQFYIALFVTPLVLDATTGIVPQSEHYITQVWHVFALPAFIAGGAALVHQFPRVRSRAPALAFGALAVVGVVYLAVFQMRTTITVADAFAVDADERAAFDWIDTHLDDRDTVVSPSINTAMLLTALTPASRYVIDGAYVRVTDDELMDRFLRAQAAFGYSDQDVFDRLDPAHAYPTSDQAVPEDQLQQHFELSAAYFLFNWEITHPESLASRMPAWRQRYAALLDEDNVLAAYPADYVYCGPRERLWMAERPARGVYVRDVFVQGGAAVYELVDASAPGARPFRGCG
ncbi:MAG: hypothetical protein HY874_01795 [Chloroflexi bacterium]|nr:hypothetical protein [Chloroflexota bacterium]